jgi:hypothetical protein
MYHGAAKIVKPKMDALKVAEAKLSKVKGKRGGMVKMVGLVSEVKHGGKPVGKDGERDFLNGFFLLGRFLVRCL